MVAWAQAADAPDAALPPDVAVLVSMVEHGGLPVVLALIAWYLRGAALTGIPVVAHLHEDDRRILRDLVDEIRERK